MNSDILFSIIIPAYNVEDYIALAIESILGQNYENCEIIIINDGSSDATGSICDKYQEKNSNVDVHHQENEGVSAARNKGISLAIGKYLWFVDGDDLIEKDALASLELLLKKYNNDLDVLGFSFQSLTNTIEKVAFNKKEIIEPVGGEEFLKHYERLSLWTFLYNKKVIDNNGIKFRGGIKIFEDNLFNIEVINHSKKIIQTNKHFYLYRSDREGSAMNGIRFNTISTSILLILNSLNAMSLTELSLDTLGRIKVSFWSSFLHFFDLHKKELNKEELINISENLYLQMKKLKTKYHKDLSVKIEIIYNNIFRKKHLCVRESLLLTFIKKAIIKSALVLGNKN